MLLIRRSPYRTLHTEALKLIMRGKCFEKISSRWCCFTRLCFCQLDAQSKFLITIHNNIYKYSKIYVFWRLLSTSLEIAGSPCTTDPVHVKHHHFDSLLLKPGLTRVATKTPRRMEHFRFPVSISWILKVLGCRLLRRCLVQQVNNEVPIGSASQQTEMEKPMKTHKPGHGSWDSTSGIWSQLQGVNWFYDSRRAAMKPRQASENPACGLRRWASLRNWNWENHSYKNLDLLKSTCLYFCYCPHLHYLILLNLLSCHSIIQQRNWCHLSKIARLDRQNLPADQESTNASICSFPEVLLQMLPLVPQLSDSESRRLKFCLLDAS